MQRDQDLFILAHHARPLLATQPAAAEHEDAEELLGVTEGEIAAVGGGGGATEPVGAVAEPAARRVVARVALPFVQVGRRGAAVAAGVMFTPLVLTLDTAVLLAVLITAVHR